MPSNVPKRGGSSDQDWKVPCSHRALVASKKQTVNRQMMNDLRSSRVPMIEAPAVILKTGPEKWERVGRSWIFRRI